MRWIRLTLRVQPLHLIEFLRRDLRQVPDEQNQAPGLRDSVRSAEGWHAAQTNSIFALREQGHEVRLMPAQYAKPYEKTNKSDYIDAEAIAEAVERPKMRFVPIKSDSQLDLGLPTTLPELSPPRVTRCAGYNYAHGWP